MSGIITPGQSKLVLHNRSEPYELTYNIAKSSGNNRRRIVLISESGSNQQNLFLTFLKLFMVFKILFCWGKTMTLKSWVAYKDVKLRYGLCQWGMSLRLVESCTLRISNSCVCARARAHARMCARTCVQENKDLPTANFFSLIFFLSLLK